MSFAKTKYYLTVIAISLMGSAVTTYFTCTGCHSNLYRYGLATFFATILWVTLWIGNGELTEFISKKVSWVKFPVQRLIVGVIATVIYTVSIVLLIARSWEYFLNFNFGSYADIVVPSLIITFFISLFLHSRGFLIAWRASAVDAERLQKENVKAQYDSLKNQVNPHFLFNSLNALTNLVYEDQDKAAKFIKQLSEVYRYVLDTREKELVSLDDEVRFLESYLFLQQIRFGDKLRLEIDLKNASGQVAPLALQMLIENAIKHNIIAEEQPLNIKVYSKDDSIVVENNLQKKTILTEDSSGLGLENIKKRYEFLTDRKVKVDQFNFVFKVELPIIQTTPA
jgi:sensor histidine kinase YesM